MKHSWYKAGLLFVLCLLLAAVTLPSFAVTLRVVLVGQRETYTLGETLQLQAQLMPMQNNVRWEWRCRMPGTEEETVVGRESKLVLELTAGHHGAVLCPVAILTDGTAVRGPEKVLVVEIWYSGLELAESPDKTVYKQGEIFNPAGVKIFALRGDGSREDVTDRCTFTPEAMELGVTEVQAVCTLRRENGEDTKFGCIIPVTVTAPVSKPDEPGETEKPDKGEKPDGAVESENADKPDDTDIPDDVGRPGSTDDPVEQPIWSEPQDGTKSVLWYCAGSVLVAGLLLWGWFCGEKDSKEEEKDDPAP